LKEYQKTWFINRLRSDDRGLFFFCLVLLIVSFYSVLSFNQNSSLKKNKIASTKFNKASFRSFKEQNSQKQRLNSIQKTDTELIKLDLSKNKLISNQFSQKIFEPGFFEVEIPEEISSMSEKITLKTSSQDDLPTPIYRYYSPDFQRVYEAGFEIYKPEIFQKLSTQKILDLIREDQNKRFKGTSIRESTIQINRNLIKREFEIKPHKKTTESFYTKVLIIINKPKIFILTCSSKRDNQLFETNSTKFFRSFSLLESKISKRIQIQETIN